MVLTTTQIASPKLTKIIRTITKAKGQENRRKTNEGQENRRKTNEGIKGENYHLHITIHTSLFVKDII